MRAFLVVGNTRMCRLERRASRSHHGWIFPQPATGTSFSASGSAISGSATGDPGRPLHNERASIPSGAMCPP
jgi:hypothetical protein